MTYNCIHKLGPARSTVYTKLYKVLCILYFDFILYVDAVEPKEIRQLGGIVDKVAGKAGKEVL